MKQNTIDMFMGLRDMWWPEIRKLEVHDKVWVANLRTTAVVAEPVEPKDAYVNCSGYGGPLDDGIAWEQDIPLHEVHRLLTIEQLLDAISPRYCNCEACHLGRMDRFYNIMCDAWCEAEMQDAEPGALKGAYGWAGPRGMLEFVLAFVVAYEKNMFWTGAKWAKFAHQLDFNGPDPMESVMPSTIDALELLA